MTTWLVAQLGARMHYAVARILAAAGALEMLYTDVCAGSWAEPFRCLPASLLPSALVRLAARDPRGIPPSRVRCFPGLGLRYAARQAAARTAEALTAVHLWAGEAFSNAVLGHGFGGSGGVYTFNSAGLGLLRRARELGLIAVVEQTIAPAAIEDALLERERAAFPDWDLPGGNGRSRAAFRAREAAEWQCADLIVCGSEFVRDGIRMCGGPAARAAVVPYGVDGPESPQIRALASRPLRVLTVGAASLRKGAPYLLDAAKALRGVAVFRLVGDIAVSAAAARRLGKAVELTGPAPRTAMARHFAWADVFLLPSLCEGSATACYEALAAGLPVIATPNAGSVVRDGVDGFIIPIRGGDAISAAIDAIRAVPSLLSDLSRNAAQRAKDFTVARYGQRLLQTLARATRPELLLAQGVEH
jgi:glycosyltransferase involved in cell wall biosynthesis